MKTLHDQFKGLIERNLVKSTTMYNDYVHDKVRNVVSFRISAVFNRYPEQLAPLRRRLIISARANFSSNIKYNI